MLSPHNLTTNGLIFKIQTPIHRVKCRKGHTILVFEIYFRFGQKNLKWPPTSFPWITQERKNRFSKFQRHMFTRDSMLMWKNLVLKFYFGFSRENSKWPLKTTFSWITQTNGQIFRIHRNMFTKDGMHM